MIKVIYRIMSIPLHMEDEPEVLKTGEFKLPFAPQLDFVILIEGVRYRISEVIIDPLSGELPVIDLTEEV